jgi:hypothetical protein
VETPAGLLDDRLAASTAPVPIRGAASGALTDERTGRGGVQAKSVNFKGKDETGFSSICDLYRKMKCFFCNVIL